jgi:cysteine-rich CWC protein
MPPFDAQHCPLCGEVNHCAVALGRSECWCFSIEIPDAVIEKIPPEAQQRACVCLSCASGRTPTGTIKRLREILRGRNGQG